MFSIDTSTKFGARIARQLTDEVVIWLTTVAKSGTPAPKPVWFLWNGEQVLVCSRPNTAKLRHLHGNPRVSVNFNATHTGGDVGVITGDAAIDEKGLTDAERTAYDEKYAAPIAGLDMTPEQFHDDYSVVIRMTPDKLSGF
jgi:PPOX class probable F420-dependent enzyme